MALVGSTLDDHAQTALETYLALLRATDAAFARLFEFVDNRERDTVLLVYSDHLPPLNAVFSQLRFRDGRHAEEQPVPWLLIDNRSRERRTHHISAWLLPTLLAEKTGVTTTPYFAALTHPNMSASATHAPSDAAKVLARLQYSGQLEHVLAEVEN
jgi:phosphoglycerol transferase MdoB-like AlkP superfamily enzyme